MSEDRNEDPGTENEDVEGHILRSANDEGGDDDVKAHVLRAANDEGTDDEGDDDVEAHVKAK